MLLLRLLMVRQLQLMKNNHWEEKKMGKGINDIHEACLQKMDIPKWMNINCPYCDSELPLRSIRSFGFKLHTRNKGDLFLEVLCEKCGIMDTVYFRNQIDKVTDLIDFTTGAKSPSCEPVLEEAMYKLQYNNVLEQIASGEK